MKLNISLFNKGIIRQDFKQHGWIGIVYLLGLLFSLPLQMLMIDGDPYRHYDYIETFFDVEQGFQILCLFIVPIIAGIFIFRYLQVKEASVMVHSLPIKRGQLYASHVMSGLLMLLVPVWITAVAAWIARGVVSFGGNLGFGELLTWVGIITMLTVLLFASSVFIGMLSGISVAQGILTYIMLLLPSGLIVLVVYQLERIYYGFSASYLMNNIVAKWSPLIRFGEYSAMRNPYSSTEIISYVLLIIGLFISGWLLYKKRPLEAVGQAITFAVLKPIFKFGVTFCTMLVLASYFAEVQDGATGWIVFGSILGTLLGYIVAEIVLEKSWRIVNLKMLKGLLVYSFIIGVVVVSIRVDVFGYETKVPKAEEVAGAYYGYNLYQLNRNLEEENALIGSDHQYINDIIHLHKTLVEKRPEVKPYSHNAHRIGLAYVLEGGRVMTREYTVPVHEVEEQLKPIVEAKEYKYARFQFHLLEKEVDFIRLNGIGPIGKEVIIADPQKIEEFKAVLKQDILNLKYKDIIGPERRWGDIQFSLKNEEYTHHFEWNKAYEGVERWLEEHDYLERARMTASDVTAMEIVKVHENEGSEKRFYNTEEQFEVNKKHSKVLNVTEQAQIEQALQHSGYYFQGEYMIKMKLVNGNTHFEDFGEKHVPDFVEEAFK